MKSSIREDQQLLRQFENCTLPFEQWNHRTHVRIAFAYLRDHSFENALAKIRSGIKAYNAAHNVPEGPSQGYNETTTQVFMHLVYVTMRAYGELYPTPDSETFCEMHPQLLTKHVLRLFYSPERRGHADAKTRFVEPDLTPLPRIPQGAD